MYTHMGNEAFYSVVKFTISLYPSMPFHLHSSLEKVATTIHTAAFIRVHKLVSWSVILELTGTKCVMVCDSGLYSCAPHGSKSQTRTHLAVTDLSLKNACDP